MSSTDQTGPNGGQWFSVPAQPSETVHVTAQLFNPVEAQQSVSLYLSDLTFDGDQPLVGDRGVGVGGWGAFDDPRPVLRPHEARIATFHLTVPSDAEPGDHVGAVVAESQPTATAAGVRVVKRIAARLYVTVPGDANPALVIADVRTRRDNPILPRHVDVAIVVRNDGNVRLYVAVSANGRHAAGPPLVVSKSSERYVVRLPVSIWGGRTTVHVRVDSRTDTSRGPTPTETRRLLVIPWWILLAAFLVFVGALALRELRRRLR